MTSVAQAQPNIALIKYWGKRDHVQNLPAVSSLSVTLQSLSTSMSVDFRQSGGPDTLQVNNAEAPAMLRRVSHCLDLVAGDKRDNADVVSVSNFPIGAGLASSASAFAALVVAAEQDLGGSRSSIELARLAGASSGSAARSLFGGIVELIAGDEQIDVQTVCDSSDWPLEVIVAITAEGPKPVSSGEAMIRGEATSPFYSGWLENQNDDLRVAREAVSDRDFARLGAVAEHNCLKMHSVMWSTRPPIVYWNSATLSCMEAIRSLQSDGVPVFFTIDAGPQVKAVCLPEAVDTVRGTLQRTAGVITTMHSSLGQGARSLEAQ
jgi:diphosphomevalonate decarboxylase